MIAFIIFLFLFNWHYYFCLSLPKGKCEVFKFSKLEVYFSNKNIRSLHKELDNIQIITIFDSPEVSRTGRYLISYGKKKYEGYKDKPLSIPILKGAGVAILTVNGLHYSGIEGEVEVKLFDKAVGIFAFYRQLVSKSSKKYKNLFQTYQYLASNKLIDRFGGKAFTTYKAKERLRNKASRDTLYLSTDALLTVKDGILTTYPTGNKSILLQIAFHFTGKPCAQIWDKKKQEKYIVPLKLILESFRVVDPIFKNPIVLNKHSISINIDGYRMNLQEGDWLYYTGIHWKKVVGQSELMDIVKGLKEAYLCVIEKIKKNEGDSVVITGYTYTPLLTREKSFIYTISCQARNDPQDKVYNRKVNAIGHR